MMKKALGSLDTSTGVFTPAPRPDYRSLLAFRVTPPAPAPAAPTPFPSSSIFNPTGVSNGHLHYGGSPTANPKINGCKPASGRSFRTQKRLELMVQLENSAVPDHMAAAMLNISLTRLKQIKKSTDYLKARMKLTLGIVVDHGQRLEQIKEQRKEVLTSMLPQALQVIANAITRPALTVQEQKLQVAVAQDLMDREGSLAKVSRSEVKQVDKFDWNFIDEQNRSIFDVIKTTAKANMNNSRTAAEIQDAVNLSADFSNSKTIDVKDQQAALDTLEKEAILEALTSGRVDA